jgi:transcriptional regulator with XRE-family HTH domain
MLKNNVEKLRLKAGLTRYALSKECGFVSEAGRVSTNSVSKLEEENKSVSVETALLIFNVLKAQGVADVFQDVFFLVQDDLDAEGSGAQTA